jgi:hypothetical protein
VPTGRHIAYGVGMFAHIEKPQPNDKPADDDEPKDEGPWEPIIDIITNR